MKSKSTYKHSKFKNLTIDPSLNNFITPPHFQEKLKRANETLEKIGAPNLEVLRQN